MTEELVERLRKAAAFSDQHGFIHGAETFRLAADEIERLRHPSPSSTCRRETLEEAARVASELGDRFAAGAERHMSPEIRGQLEERAGGCYQAAKAIRALIPSPPPSAWREEDRAQARAEDGPTHQTSDAEKAT